MTARLDVSSGQMDGGGYTVLRAGVGKAQALVNVELDLHDDGTVTWRPRGAPVGQLGLAPVGPGPDGTVEGEEWSLDAGVLGSGGRLWHRHTNQGQALRHKHDRGDEPHGYYEHHEDGHHRLCDHDWPARD